MNDISMDLILEKAESNELRSKLNEITDAVSRMFDFSQSRIDDILKNDGDNIAELRYWVGYKDALLRIKQCIGGNAYL